MFYCKHMANRKVCNRFNYIFVRSIPVNPIISSMQDVCHMNASLVTSKLPGVFCSSVVEHLD